MATSVSKIFHGVPGDRKQGYFALTLDTYATNGVPITAASFGLAQYDFAMPVVLGPTLNATVNNWSWDQTNQKLKLYNGTTEVTNAVDVSAFVVIFDVRGF